MSTTGSKRALLTAQTASLRVEIEARRLEGSRRIEMAHLEAEETARRAKYEADLETKREELRSQEMQTQLIKAEAELQVLTEEDQISNKVLLHAVPDYSHKVPDYSHKVPDYSHKVPDDYHKVQDYSHKVPDDYHKVQDYSHKVPDDYHKVPVYSHKVQDYSYKVPDDNHNVQDYNHNVQDYNHKTTENFDMKSLLEVLNLSVNRNHLPTPESPIFSGYPLKFTSWRAAFSALIG